MRGGRVFSRLPFSPLPKRPIPGNETKSSSCDGVVMKRLFDVLFSLLAIVCLSPLFVLLALAVRFESEGPVFYRQPRVGRRGKLFQILKFRSMVINADQLGPYYTVPGDKRVTSVGHFLRKTSLDELPQLLNVFWGEMSVVGPRPDVPAQKALYSEGDWLKRMSVRPGITGLAQAVLRSSASDDKRRSLDLEYIDRASFWFDIKILWMTLRTVLKGSC